MKFYFYQWIKNAQNTVLAPHCPLCATAIASDAGICTACRAELPVLAVQCEHCAIALPETATARVCAECARRPRFDSAHAGFHYRQPIAWLIGGLKYRQRLPHARLLGDLLADSLAASAACAPDVLAPVPLHPAAFRRRGFNQAERIAERVASRLGWRLERDLFRRVRDTPRQSTLDAGARAANVRNAFAADGELQDRHVALVDDVMTTARTASAVARCARAAGATRVDMYCVARA